MICGYRLLLFAVDAGNNTCACANGITHVHWESARPISLARAKQPKSAAHNASPGNTHDFAPSLPINGNNQHITNHREQHHPICTRPTEKEGEQRRDCQRRDSNQVNDVFRSIVNNHTSRFALESAISALSKDRHMHGHPGLKSNHRMRRQRRSYADPYHTFLATSVLNAYAPWPCLPE
jgi:hypothetical protein